MSYQYIVSDHFSTGEGMTISIAILPDTFGEEYTKRFLKDVFTDYFADGYRMIPKDEFFECYDSYIPDIVIEKVEQPVGAFHWYSQIHLNLS